MKPQRRSRRPWLGLALALPLALAGCGREASSDFVRPKPNLLFKPKEMADSIHAAVAAERAVYARTVVQRLAYDQKLLRASDQWATNQALPPHLSRLIAESVAQQGVEFHAMVRSLAPIDPRNQPQTQTERQGIEAITANPAQPFYAEEYLGGRPYLTAVYADRAVVTACASCHNEHPASIKKDFKLGDVIGAVIVRVPLEL